MVDQMVLPERLPPANLRDAYLLQLRQKRLYGGILLVIFVAMMVAGFRVAEDRNAGGFRNGLPQVLDFPAGVVAEVWEKLDNIPGYFVTYLPALIETINIAAVSTLVGAAFGLLLSLWSTRGLAR